MASPEAARARLPSLTKYEVIEEIGHGGMATVYRARDPRLGREVAVKIIHPHLRDSREVAHRFAVEAKAVAKLRHRNIVEVYDVSAEDEPEQYLVTELLEGRTLRSILAERGAMPPEVAAALGIELCDALEHAHAQSIVHRDIKPENVFIEHPAFARRRPGDVPSSRPKEPGAASGKGASARRRDAGPTVKLMDFGIAKLLDAQGVTSTGQVLGSPAHMAPEQIEGGDVDARADVFALGVLLYECMVGELPFSGANPAQVLRRVLDGLYTPAEQAHPRVGKRFSRLLDRALARDPAERLPDVVALREALAAELERVEIGDARELLDRWAEDPEALAQAEEPRLVQKLCALGKAAARVGDPVGAADDYNRALAYAPHDAELLKIVAGMRRNEARARLLRKLAPVLLGAVAAGTLAFLVGKALRARPDVPAPPASVAVAASSAAPAMSAPPASTSASAGPPATTASTARIPVTVRPVRPVDPRVVSRKVTITRLRPENGVLVRIDRSETATPVSVGQTFDLDGEEHTLRFSCLGEMCEQKVVTIAPGRGDDALRVELRILPARLVVDGEAGHLYGLVERPELAAVPPGAVLTVPMSLGKATVTVRDHDSGATKSVDLRANQTTRVEFP
jgi:serine/threonine-protein kinase